MQALNGPASIRAHPRISVRAAATRELQRSQDPCCRPQSAWPRAGQAQNGRQRHAAQPTRLTHWQLHHQICQGPQPQASQQALAGLPAHRAKLGRHTQAVPPNSTGSARACSSHLRQAGGPAQGRASLPPAWQRQEQWRWTVCGQTHLQRPRPLWCHMLVLLSAHMQPQQPCC